MSFTKIFVQKKPKKGAFFPYPKKSSFEVTLLSLLSAKKKYWLFKLYLLPTTKLKQ